MSRFFRYRLLTFLATVIVMGTVVGVAGRWYVNATSFAIKNYPIDGTRIFTAWRVKGDTHSLEYAVFIPRGISHSYSLIGRRNKPRTKGVSCREDLLYMNGVPVDTSGPCPFFIYTREQTLIKMKMTESECRFIKDNGFEKLGDTRLWKEKLLPQLRENGLYP